MYNVKKRLFIYILTLFRIHCSLNYVFFFYLVITRRRRTVLILSGRLTGSFILCFC